MPCYSLPCWVISWPDEVHHLFPCSHQNPRITNRNLQHWTITNWMAEVKCHSEPAGLNYERHQDILPWNPLSFLIQNIKKRRLSILFSFPANSINCTTTKKESRLYINFDYVFLLPIRERLYLLRHCFWQAGHAILSFVCLFFFVWWVMSALSALWTDSRIRRWFSIIRLLFIHAFTLHRALLQLCPIKGKGFYFSSGHWQVEVVIEERESKGKGYIFVFAFTTQ